VAELVRKDRELLAAASRLYEDAIPFLQALRSRGMLIALVSNCVENTRQLLSDFGVSALADAVVLSCETGCAKALSPPTPLNHPVGARWRSAQRPAKAASDGGSRPQAADYPGHGA